MLTPGYPTRELNVPRQGGAASPPEKAAGDCFAVCPPACSGPPGSAKGVGAAREGLGGRAA